MFVREVCACTCASGSVLVLGIFYASLRKNTHKRQNEEKKELEWGGGENEKKKSTSANKDIDT